MTSPGGRSPARDEPTLPPGGNMRCPRPACPAIAPRPVFFSGLADRERARFRPLAPLSLTLLELCGR